MEKLLTGKDKNKYETVYIMTVTARNKQTKQTKRAELSSQTIQLVQ